MSVTDDLNNHSAVNKKCKAKGIFKYGENWLLTGGIYQWKPVF
jgi:hypothetical protein